MTRQQKLDGRGLIGAGHCYRGSELWSAALSLANNRRSKIEKLRAHGIEHCDQIADRFQASLDSDCAAFLAEHPNHPPRFAVALREAATWRTQDYQKAAR